MAYVTARVDRSKGGEFPAYGEELFLRRVDRVDGHHWYEARVRPYLDEEDRPLLFGPLKGTDTVTRLALGTGRVVPFKDGEEPVPLTNTRQTMRLQIEGSITAVLEAAQFAVPA